MTQQLEESEEKLVELQKLAEQSRTLKDEVDILRCGDIRYFRFKINLQIFDIKKILM